MITLTSPWYAYARQSPDEPGGSLLPPPRLEWGTYPGTGPGTEAFVRDVRGRKLLELGCGAGRNAAYLAGREGAHVTAIDMIDLQIRRARDHYGHLPGVSFLTCDALRFLRHGTERFDGVYSVFGAVGLVDPDVLLPAIRARLNQHRPLVFSVPHPQRAGRRPALGRALTDFLALPDGTHRALARWEFDVPQWAATLAYAGFRLSRAQELKNPRHAHTPSTLLITARRL
ncbi:class I SAM-dependent methyltransferase [Streptomyces sp. SID3212]|uniref:class I SAM-dependent methyltransferase n=1 Tax=Streptomyces sp. SID3212 TaxID=2690259 RepID=UPI0013685D70|nr:class I SAM-dependent methyltransferase [Streptomyces sp. SID3212]MYV51338.1 methyltransferase domain-containing protein [Streptomyces sp. SID3212]